MRKIIILSFITLDGIMQAPGGPKEDTSGGFKYGGWAVPYFDDFAGKVMSEQMGHPFDLLLGRKTTTSSPTIGLIIMTQRTLSAPGSTKRQNLWLPIHPSNQTGQAL